MACGGTSGSPRRTSPSARNRNEQNGLAFGRAKTTISASLWECPALCYLRKVSLTGFFHVYFPGKFQTSSRKGLRRHHGDADLHLVLAGRRDRLVGSCLVRLLRRWRRGEGHW